MNASYEVGCSRSQTKLSKSITARMEHLVGNFLLVPGENSLNIQIMPVKHPDLLT